MLFIANLLKSQLDKITAIKRIWIAYSGGMDSHVLLHAFMQIQPQYGFEICPIHINHGLHHMADVWESHCMNVCSFLGLSFHTLKVEVLAEGKQNLEEAARIARYTAFKTCVEEQDYLVTAHHADDQAETFLLQLFRGSGTRGLSGIPTLSSFGKGFLWRPLLSSPRDKLMAYAVSHKLNWVEDESNRDIYFDRNYLRHTVFPSLKARWNYLVEGIYQSTKHCAEAELLLEELAREDLQNIEEEFLPRKCRLNLLKLRSLSPLRRHNVLRYWLRQQGFPLPGRVHLQQFESHFIHARSDANPKLCWSHVQLRRYLNYLYALPNPYCESIKEQLVWELGESLVLPFGIGQLSAVKKQGEGIQVSVSDKVEIRFREGGEKIKLIGNEHSHRLKKWFQELRIPPWERGRIPLIYINGELAQVLVNSHRCISSQFTVKPDEMGIFFALDPFKKTLIFV